MLAYERVLGDSGGGAGAMSAIPTLLVGGGRMGTSHLQGIARVPELAAVTAAVEPHPAHRERLRRDHGIERLYDDLDSALEAEPAEAVFICTPNHLHARYALACLRSGRHVFVEEAPGPDRGRRR